MRVIALRERPTIRFGRDRYEVGTIEIEELRKRGAVRFPTAGDELDVTRDEKSIQPQVHRERVARDRRSVAEHDAHVAFASDDEPITVEAHAIGGE
jgi:hypothetical protein